MSTSILIVSFTFPPAPGIGGRRWVKFAKYLKRNGHLVKVIAARNQHDEVSEWTGDTAELAGDITYINSSYPKFLGVAPRSLYEKLAYRVSLLYARLRCSGNYYDKSNYWKEALLSTSRQLLKKHAIRNVLCTIGPFRSADYLLDLKKEFPDVNFIVDYRDPWTNNKTSFGFTSISRKRWARELAWEKRVLKGFDRITAVSQEMAGHFYELLEKQEVEKKFTAIPNGFDPDDLTGFQKTSAAPAPGKLNIVFAGTFYLKSVHVFRRLIEALSKVEQKYPEKKGYLNFVFAGIVPAEMMPYFSRHPENLSFVGRKKLKEIYQLISGADLCALFLTDDMNYSFSTKFYEYLALNKKIISFSQVKGNNAAFIEKNGLGYAADNSTMEATLEKLMFSSRQELLLKAQDGFDPQAFNIKNLTLRLESVLKK